MTLRDLFLAEVGDIIVSDRPNANIELVIVKLRRNKHSMLVKRVDTGMLLEVDCIELVNDKYVYLVKSGSDMSRKTLDLKDELLNELESDLVDLVDFPPEKMRDWRWISKQPLMKFSKCSGTRIKNIINIINQLKILHNDCITI
jgi:hypothetical protein